MVNSLRSAGRNQKKQRAGTSEKRISRLNNTSSDSDINSEKAVHVAPNSGATINNNIIININSSGNG